MNVTYYCNNNVALLVDVPIVYICLVYTFEVVIPHPVFFKQGPMSVLDAVGFRSL